MGRERRGGGHESSVLYTCMKLSSSVSNGSLVEHQYSMVQSVMAHWWSISIACGKALGSIPSTSLPPRTSPQKTTSNKTNALAMAQRCCGVYHLLPWSKLCGLPLPYDEQ